VIHFTPPTDDDSIQRDALDLTVGPIWRELHNVVPLVAPTSLSYDGQRDAPTLTVPEGETVFVPGYALPLWAVDDCEWVRGSRQIVLRSTVAVRGGTNRTWLLRVGYHVIAVGLMQ
jgi:hypothetical protein